MRGEEKKLTPQRWIYNNIKDGARCMVDDLRRKDEEVVLCPFEYNQRIYSRNAFDLFCCCVVNTLYTAAVYGLIIVYRVEV